MDIGKKKIMEQFNEIASTYDSDPTSEFASKHYGYILNILMMEQFENILDIGCGTGTFLRKLLDEKPQVKAHAIDISEKMLEIAKSKLPKRAEVMWGECETLPYENKSFDIVLMIDVFNYSINYERTIYEAFRVLRSSGKLIICDPLYSGIMRIIKKQKISSESQVRKMLVTAGFDLINITTPIPHGYICVADKRA